VMGLCSYLLIGFWFSRTYPDPKKITPWQAGIKAFMTTRVGDVLMLLGIAYLYSQTGTLNFHEILGSEHVLDELIRTPSYIAGLNAAGLIGLLLFAGTVGKSSQFPLHVWLPDAMEGPTPVSAMIHAATMVSAGVYAMVRMFPLLQAGLGHDVATAPMYALGLIGAFTALFTATIAVAQNDVKKVLAYSTISQLGYMLAALGVGAYVAAAFHLITHAFFKALLFLGSGSIIHGVEHGHHHVEHLSHAHKRDEHAAPFDPQDMMNMGGLRDKMPITFWTFVAGGLALAGFPLVTAGFWSKDLILGGAWEKAAEGNCLGWFVFVALALAALLTAFYTARQICLTFLGQPRTEAAEHARENVWTMTAPLVALAVLALVTGWAGIEENFPLVGGLLPNWFHHFVGATIEHSVHLPVPEQFPYPALWTSLIVALGGLFLGWWVYGRKPLAAGQADPLTAMGIVHKVLKNKYYFDELYDIAFIWPTLRLARWTYEFVDKVVIDGFLHGVARSAYRTGEGFRVFDRYAINGGADGLAGSLRAFGDIFRRVTQTGRVQDYLLLAMVCLLVFISLAVTLNP
jgi:NADH-quinone oxidoreductase subunit L